MLAYPVLKGEEDSRYAAAGRDSVCRGPYHTIVRAKLVGYLRSSSTASTAPAWDGQVLPKLFSSGQGTREALGLDDWRGGYTMIHHVEGCGLGVASPLASLTASIGDMLPRLFSLLLRLS